MLKTLKMVACFLFVLILTNVGTPISIADEELVVVPIPQPTLQELTAKFALQYNVKYSDMSCVIKAESNWNPHAVGDHGLANDITQFHKDTFLRWSKEMGEELDYNSSYDHIKLMAWAFSKGERYRNAWTTWKHCK